MGISCDAGTSKYDDSPNCHTFKKVIAKSSASTSADSRFNHVMMYTAEPEQTL